MSRLHVANRGRLPLANGSQGALRVDGLSPAFVAVRDDPTEEQTTVTQLLDA